MTKTWSDDDKIETKEWLDALHSVIKHEGKDRAQYLLEVLIEDAKKQGLKLGVEEFVTPYCNTIPKSEEPKYPGELQLEAKNEAAIRWNSIAMVLRAKRKAGGVGGHLSTYASIANLYEVGFYHFFRANTEKKLGDLIYFQGHASEGIYSRAYLEGRLDREHLENFRQEVGGQGLSSYPHPYLMPDFWQFATVSLGLGLLQGVYQARFLKYLDHRKLLPALDRKVWVFCGDGEMDEPESIAGLSLAGREKLDNLIFVVNCNLQRLDGLVRSNHKIVQELESLFKGFRWNVIKVLWDSQWDKLFNKDKSGNLIRRLTECVDGDLQTAYVRGGTYRREFIFNTEELTKLVEDWTDEELGELKRGAHDPIKIYAAYEAAINHKEGPTVILAQGVKGFGLGTRTTEGRNIAHNQLEMTDEELKTFRERFKLPLNDKELLSLEYYKPAEDSEELKYLIACREKLGGFLPERKVVDNPLPIPDLATFESILQGSPERPMSTTMVLGRIINVLLKDKNIGKRIVPIFSDEVRTFGLEALFRQVGIYSPVGQLYTPEDREQFLYYHEMKEGQVLEEGITEAGCMCSWIASATSYAHHRFPTIPFFTYYSMFGFQRVGDLIWAAADMRARGFLIGATAGRTTLEGEGLQHQDGSSLLIASTVPSCRAYDPAFGYEMTVIIHHGLNEMFAEQKDVFYYIMAMNEKYLQPGMPKGVEEGIIKGIYLLEGGEKEKPSVQLLGSGAILNEVIAASKLLKEDFNISTNVFSVTSFCELHRDGLSVERQNRLSVNKTPKQSFIEKVLSPYKGPVVAATDYVRAYADLIRPYLNRTYITLGTDGYGRSDTREKLRYFFEVDRYQIAVAAIYALAKENAVKSELVEKAIKKYGIDPSKPNPISV